MKINKLNKKEIDYLIKIDIASHWSNQAACNPNLAEMEFKFVADEIVKNNPKIKYKDIFIDYHEVVSEYCVYIKGEWSGYLEPHQVDGYNSYEGYYGFENMNNYPIMRGKY